MGTSININLTLWTAERERLATSSPAELRGKAAAWLDWRSAPKAPTLLRNALLDFVEAKIASYADIEASDDGSVGPSMSTETRPTPSSPVLDLHESPDMPPVTVGQDGVPAKGHDRMLQHVSEGEHTVAAAEAVLAKQAEEIAWLRRMLEAALRTAQATGVKLAQPAPTTASTTVPAATKELVFFGLPLGEGASQQDARDAVHKFCSETLQIPMPQAPYIVRLGVCRTRPTGFPAQRPATVVVARLDAPTARAVCMAKRGLPGTCLVSIDEQRSRQECQRRWELRRQRLEVGQDGGEGVPCEGQSVGVEGRSEGGVAALH